MTTKDNNRLQRALKQARRSGAHVDSVLGLTNPNSPKELAAQAVHMPTLEELAQELQEVAIVQDDSCIA